ncbi:MAG: UDP-N-acetylmuramate dehydrogenase [Chloroflexi bacterium]|nr:UDP-N-acetylmuramate dehydrogenase [Chloroflexota bacterium]MDA1240461.1 UDP-N-acetylmuramate dehydrogenase [Chloroflexota bacterium]
MTAPMPPSPSPLPEAPPELGLVRDEPMARHTYIRLGGPAAYFGVPEDLDAVARIAAWARDVDVPLRVVGGGSNLLVADEGVQAVVLSLRHACGTIAFDGTEVTAGAAVMLPALARQAAEHDLGGLEFAIGIPGTVGGALQTNAGIGDGRCIGDLVQSVEVLRDGQCLTVPREEISIDYRITSLRGSGDIVLAARLLLTLRPRAECEAESRALLETRQRTQPTADPNNGSVFSNPPDDHAGRLIEAAGCKGLAVGGASVSTLHANFIVHDGNASTAHVVGVMAAVQRRVMEQFGVRLVPEVEWWGDGPLPSPFQT